MSNEIAVAAITAAKNWNRWGPYTSRAYAEKRGVPSGLLTLARQLEAVKDIPLIADVTKEVTE